MRAQYWDPNLDNIPKELEVRQVVHKPPPIDPKAPIVKMDGKLFNDPDRVCDQICVK